MPSRFVAFRFVSCLIAFLVCVVSAVAQTSTPSHSQIQEIAPAEPLEVAAGITVTQITGVDQKSENFGAVLRIRLKWQDAQLEYDPAIVGKDVQVMASREFLAMARSRGIYVPVSTIENQQSRSFEKASLVIWFPDGRATFVQEVITTLQAPDFDFRHFPFDHQSFYIRLLAHNPVEFFRFVPLADGNGLGDTLGEEEWVVTSDWTEVDEVQGITGLQSSRFSLGFSAHRHQLYYWARIFVPLTLLMSVAWANLFLEEYRRRIDIASGNLLAFIAYNFTISNELPRLGYLTFLDTLMMAMFMISASAVAYNVALRRLSLAGRETQAQALDWHVTIWGFPFILIGSVVLIYASFFW